jgi:hypothetical protein
VSWEAWNKEGITEAGFDGETDPREEDAGVQDDLFDGVLTSILKRFHTEAIPRGLKLNECLGRFVRAEARTLQFALRFSNAIDL